jgi:hypothetical protein
LKFGTLEEPKGFFNSCIVCYFLGKGQNRWDKRLGSGILYLFVQFWSLSLAMSKMKGKLPVAVSSELWILCFTSIQIQGSRYFVVSTLKNGFNFVMLCIFPYIYQSSCLCFFAFGLII